MRHTLSGRGPVHLVGIGGIGMSGIAETLRNCGVPVQGSDIADNANVMRLRQLGIPIVTGHAAKNVDNAGVVVVSSAIRSDNPEARAARERKIPVVGRAEMLGELMRGTRAISISGTHGKTTTTSLVGWLLEVAGLDPTVINGGIVNSYGSNARQGSGDWMVVEADESDCSFLQLPSVATVVTNIDPEHMENYDSFDDVRDAYRRYVNQIPYYGFAVLCVDHPEVQRLLGRISERRVITYGLRAQADIFGTRLRLCDGGYRFDVILGGDEPHAGRTISNLFLPMWGRHNVTNALACVAIAQELEISDDHLRLALAEFRGVNRRFTRCGETGGVTVIDDYAHHPVEISAVLAASREAFSGNIVAVIQPHRYTRLSDLYDSFCTCVGDADVVIVADVYSAGEQPIDGATRENLVEGMRRCGHRNVLSLASPDELAETVHGITRPGDAVVCLGAGSITQWAHKLPHALDVVASDRVMDRAS